MIVFEQHVPEETLLPFISEGKNDQNTQRFEMNKNLLRNQSYKNYKKHRINRLHRIESTCKASSCVNVVVV